MGKVTLKAVPTHRYFGDPLGFLHKAVFQTTGGA
jgi:hypothetical protein